MLIFYIVYIILCCNNINRKESNTPINAAWDKYKLSSWEKNRNNNNKKEKKQGETIK